MQSPRRNLRGQAVQSPIGRTTSRGAADIDRDAKAASAKLRDILRNQPPWSREVEAHRQSARNLFLALLFGHPLSTHSQSLEPLWHHTTYIIISTYRSTTSSLESALPPNLGGRKGKQNSPQHIELKKVLTRFRQILASEEAFYRSLISRLVAFYQLQSLSREILASISIGVAAEVEHGGTKEGLAPEMSVDERREKLALVYKALICLGDLERYREQYEESARREVREGRVNLAKLAERFTKSWTYYETARALIPDDGSAFNQLAVISTYLSDDFLCIYYYFRALAVRHAFKNIEEIMDKFLRKLHEKWPGMQGRRRREGMDDSGDGLEGVTAEQTKADLLILTAILYRRVGFSSFSQLEAKFLLALGSLLRDRQLPSEVIVKITAIGIGLHWQTRQSASIAGPTDDQKQIQRRHEAETISLRLLLGIYGQVLGAGETEVNDALRARANGSALDDDTTELHQYISAVLRRLLPSLRILSRWLKLHLEYIMRVHRSGSLEREIDEFWNTFMRFAIGLATLFPIDQLPSLVVPLEEDVDMRGFIPLFRGTGQRENLEDSGHDFHPNEEQLMRIADLQVDAKLLAQYKSGALTVGERNGSAVPLSLVDPLGLQRDRPDDMASVSTETEDDPVNLAMRATLGGSTEDGDEEDEEEEIILWAGNSNRVSGNGPSPPQPRPAANQRAHQPLASPPSSSTAYDLLNNLMLDTPSAQVAAPYSRPTNAQSSPAPVPGQSSPGMLFGGDATGSSIWTMTREESGRGVPRPQNIANIWKDTPSPAGIAPGLPSPATQPTWGRPPSGQVPNQEWMGNGDGGTTWQVPGLHWGQEQQGQYPR